MRLWSLNREREAAEARSVTAAPPIPESGRSPGLWGSCMIPLENNDARKGQEARNRFRAEARDRGWGWLIIRDPPSEKPPPSNPVPRQSIERPSVRSASRDGLTDRQRETAALTICYREKPQGRPTINPRTWNVDSILSHHSFVPYANKFCPSCYYQHRQPATLASAKVERRAYYCSLVHLRSTLKRKISSCPLKPANIAVFLQWTLPTISPHRFGGGLHYCGFFLAGMESRLSKCLGAWCPTTSCNS